MSTTYLEQAHRHAIRQEVRKIAQVLQETLGQKLTAYAVGVKDPKAIGRYAKGTQEPREGTERRLRDVYQIVKLLSGVEAPATIRAWMIGMNPQLGDEAPIESLHQADNASVLHAADNFRTGG